MAEKQKVCACCGSYDGIPHEGHKHFLQTAKDKGGALTVFIVEDRTIRRNKKREPIFSQDERIRNIQALGIADNVVPLIGTDKDQLQQILALQPDCYFLTPDQANKRFERRLFRRLRRIGTSITVIPKFMPHLYSTTRLHFS